MAGYAVLALTQEMFCGQFRGKHEAYDVVDNPLPKDAKVVKVEINPKTGEMEFVIFSEKFKWVKPGMPLPYIKTPMCVPRG